jgi:hypothetical protein
MKKFLLVLMIASMYKTSVHAGSYDHEMYKAAQWGTPWRISTKEIRTPASIPFEVASISLPVITENINRLQKELKDKLAGEKSQGSLAQFQLNQPDRLIDNLATLELVKLALNRATSWGDSKKLVTNEAKILESLTAEIDRQDYERLATILEDNKAYRLLCVEKMRLVARAEVYNILNDFKTERSIKLKCKHSDKDKKPDSGLVSQREISKNIVQLLQVKLYRNIKTN